MRPVFADGFPGDSLSDLKTLEPKKTALQTSKGRSCSRQCSYWLWGEEEKGWRRRDEEGARERMDKGEKKCD